MRTYSFTLLEGLFLQEAQITLMQGALAGFEVEVAQARKYGFILGMDPFHFEDGKRTEIEPGNSETNYPIGVIGPCEDDGLKLPRKIPLQDSHDLPPLLDTFQNY